MPAAAGCAARVGCSAFSIAGFCRNCSTVDLRTAAAWAGAIDEPSASRRRRIARACSWLTRDSFTPIS
jgi:hypothetical protein